MGTHQPPAVFDDGKVRLAVDDTRNLVFVDPSDMGMGVSPEFKNFLLFLTDTLDAVEKSSYKSAKRYRNQRFGILSTYIVAVQEAPPVWNFIYEADPRWLVLPPEHIPDFKQRCNAIAVIFDDPIVED